MYMLYVSTAHLGITYIYTYICSASHRTKCANIHTLQTYIYTCIHFMLRTRSHMHTFTGACIHLYMHTLRAFNPQHTHTYNTYIHKHTQVKELRQPVTDMKGDADRTNTAVKQLAEQNNKLIAMQKEQTQETKETREAARDADVKSDDAKRAAVAAAKAAKEADLAARKKQTSVIVCLFACVRVCVCVCREEDMMIPHKKQSVVCFCASVCLCLFVCVCVCVL